METTVGKLEALFQKSEADLDYIEKRLKVDFITGATESGSSVKENPARLLENLAAIKAKHAALSTQVKEIAAAQKETMDSIREQLDGTLHVIERFQQTADVKVEPLTVSEQEATEMVGSAVNSRGTVPSS